MHDFSLPASDRSDNIEAEPVADGCQRRPGKILRMGVDGSFNRLADLATAFPPNQPAAVCWPAANASASLHAGNALGLAIQ